MIKKLRLGLFVALVTLLCLKEERLPVFFSFCFCLGVCHSISSWSDEGPEGLAGLTASCEDCSIGAVFPLFAWSEPRGTCLFPRPDPAEGGFDVLGRASPTAVFPRFFEVEAAGEPCCSLGWWAASRELERWPRSSSRGEGPLGRAGRSAGSFAWGAKEACVLPVLAGAHGFPMG